MKRYIIFLITSLILSSCRYFGPVDSDNLKNIKFKPNISDLIGVWEADSFSYANIKKEYGETLDTIRLKISKSGEIIAINLPDMVADGFGRSINKQFITCKGTWDLDSLNGSWNLSVKYDPCELYRKGCWTSYDLYNFKGDIVIWVFLGDPDEGRRLLFKRN